MKAIKIITLFFLCIAIKLQAQTIDMDYSYTTEPFKWTIYKIEQVYNSTQIYLTVTNIGKFANVLNFSKGDFVITEDHPEGIRASYNSAASTYNPNIYMQPGKTIPIKLKFPTISIFHSKKIIINIATDFKLELFLQSKFSSLSDLNKRMQTWEGYYYSKRKIIPTYKNESDLKVVIQKEVEKWQKKGEFETTSAWKTRVNDKTREEFIREISNKYLTEYKKEQEQIREEQNALAQSYEDYKNNLLNQFYKTKIVDAKKQFVLADFELKPYDADHETFMIHSSKYGDILLPVAISEAPAFKQNWNSIKSHIEPEFVPNGDDVSLAKLIFTNNNKEFVYDSKTKANYAITDVKYNFTPIEIADINIANLNIDGISAIPDDISSKVVGKTSSEVLTAQNAQVGKVTVTASERSDVDTAIPLNKTNSNTSTFAVIIANENYHTVSKVPYAEKDGEIFGRYLTKAIGLPQDHVKTYKNASFGNMAAALKHIENLSEAFGRDLNLLFYYAGHGMPNEKTKNPMLMPVDGDAAIPETCYDLDKVISTLGGLNAKSVIVMLDACFSGTERGNNMLMAARGIRIKSNQSEPIGNMVILSASQGDETAYPYNTEQHGLFTFFLLKKLQENKGDVTLGELSDYITEQVKRQSVVSNGKLQTPTVAVSPTIKDSWRNLKIK
ncbi:MAG: caspase family protein [Muribaculaceae bacterium]|nr:caspase family protein [Muribaculaceae bacterium]